MFYKNIKILIFTSLLITLLNINIARVVAGNVFIELQSTASEIEVSGAYNDQLNKSQLSDIFKIESFGDFSMILNIKIKNTEILCGTLNLWSKTYSKCNETTLNYFYNPSSLSPPEECSYAEILLNIDIDNIDDLSGKKNVTSQQISLLSSYEQSITIDETASSSIRCAFEISDKNEDSLDEKQKKDGATVSDFHYHYTPLQLRHTEYHKFKIPDFKISNFQDSSCEKISLHTPFSPLQPRHTKSRRTYRKLKIPDIKIPYFKIFNFQDSSNVQDSSYGKISLQMME